MVARKIVAVDETLDILTIPLSGDTYELTRALLLTGETVTGSGATNLLSLVQTWNTTGTPTAFKLNVTDTASNAASLLLDLQVGGTSRLSLTKAGLLKGTDLFSIGQATADNAIVKFNADSIDVQYYATSVARIGNSGVQMRSSAVVGWTSATNVTASADTILLRDAAGILALRNGTSTNTLRVYKTYTDGSNYERMVYGDIDGGGNWLLHQESAGTGTVRALAIRGGNYNVARDVTIQNGATTTATFGFYGHTVTPTALSGSLATSVFDISHTWNTTGTPTALKANVIDTASNAASLLLDLQVGGTSKFKVAKDGTTTFGGNLYLSGGVAGFAQGGFGGITVNMGSSGSFGINSSTASLSWYSDTFLFRDAANTLALRNSTNAQAFNVYNTYTDASNYERAYMRYTANALYIGSESAGTGSNSRVTVFANVGSGDWHFKSFATGGSSFAYITLTNETAARIKLRDSGAYSWANTNDSSGTIDTSLFRIAAGIVGVRGAGTTNGAALSLVEQTAPAAPAANGAYIYAEDNGAGKTRLMVQFASGAAQQIAIEP